MESGQDETSTPRSYLVTDYASQQQVKINRANKVSVLKQKALATLGYSTRQCCIRIFIRDDPKVEIKQRADLILSTDLVAVVTPMDYYTACQDSEGDCDDNGDDERIEKIKGCEKAVKALLERDGIRDKLAYIEMIHPEAYKTIERYVEETAKRKVNVSKKSQHPEWFAGVNVQYETKEDYMKHLGRSRASNLIKRVKKQLDNKLSKGRFSKKEIQVRREAVKAFVDNLKILLDEYKCSECYFDRSCKQTSGSLDEKRCFCDSSSGLFSCGGTYSGEECENGHKINPYENLHSRISFSCWELDHVKDVSQIVGGIYKVLIEHPRRQVKANAKPAGTETQEQKTRNIFEELFTKKNLKLVHKICHDRTPHDIQTPVSVSVFVDDDERDP